MQLVRSEIVTQYIVNSVESLQKCIGDIRSDFEKHKFLRINSKTGKDRSLDFNALSHCWYEQISRELHGDDALGWKAFCKLYFGVPIMRAEDEQFREFYDGAIRKQFTYEQKLMAMRYFPVTSLMTNPQFKKYCDGMQEHFAKQGVALEFPPEDEKKK